MPISLFTHMTLAMAAVALASVSNDGMSTTPSDVIAHMRSSAPSCLAAWTDSSTALCSIGVVTIAFRPESRCARHAPRMAKLSASVPPDVKQISSAAAPKQSRDPLPSFVERGASVAPPLMDAGRIPEARPEERQHRLEHLGSHGCSGGVVEKYGIRHSQKYTVWVGPSPQF